MEGQKQTSSAAATIKDKPELKAEYDILTLTEKLMNENWTGVSEEPPISQPINNF